MTETLEQALPADVFEMAQQVLQQADQAEKGIATAESCTGGMLAALLTDIPGHSHVFERGFVVYSDDAKCDLLGIARRKVDDCGAVSREVALAMAEGALARSRADVALSITGFAGPPGEGEAGEEGLVHFACARSGAPTAHREMHFGPVGRQAVRIRALRTALDMLEHAIVN
jgi:nicotinamide-nucleotide amidase